MIRIKVLGPGCRFCEMMEQVAIAGLMDLIDKNPDIRANIEHIEDLEAINQYPILVTPGLVINEHLACAGRVPNKSEVIRWISEALEQTG